MSLFDLGTDRAGCICGTKPVDFPGTAEEMAENRATHRFGSEDRCMGCDVKVWYITANYACGIEPPRERFTSYGATCEVHGTEGIR